MSGIFQGLIDPVTQRLYTDPTGPIASYFRGLPLTAAGAVAIDAAGGAPTAYGPNAIPLRSGRVAFSTAAPSSYSGGLPYAADGCLAGAGSGTIDGYSAGVPRQGGALA